jgi:hypothetical protein
MTVKLRAISCSIWRNAFLVSALIVLAGTAVPDGACAEGPFDFLFGGFQRSTPAPDAPPPTAGRVTTPAQGRERVSGNGSVGRSAGFCVRLCDGQHFRIGKSSMGQWKIHARRSVLTATPSSFSGARFEPPTPRTVNAIPSSNPRSSTARNKWQTAPVTVKILLAWFHWA